MATESDASPIPAALAELMASIRKTLQHTDACQASLARGVGNLSLQLDRALPRVGDELEQVHGSLLHIAGLVGEQAKVTHVVAVAVERIEAALSLAFAHVETKGVAGAKLDAAHAAELAAAAGVKAADAAELAKAASEKSAQLATAAATEGATIENGMLVTRTRAQRFDGAGKRALAVLGVAISMAWGALMRDCADHGHVDQKAHYEGKP